MIHVWTCECGWSRETLIPWEFGHIYQCESCKNVYTMVYPQGGGKEWILISPDQVEFHDLLGTLYNEN